MKVKQLITQLQELPPDTTVAIYCQMSEDSDLAHRVKLVSKEEGPYNKGDDVWFLYGLDADVKIAIIS